MCALLGLVAANLYRRVTGTMRKGEGCLSDLPNLVEVSYGDILLTRDEELVECARLLATVVKDAQPEVRLVPRR